MRLKALSLAAGALLLSAGAASAAVITHDLNLRAGPGTRYHVIDTMPAGARVAVLNCGGSWCRVDWRGKRGYASRNYLTGGRGYAHRRYYYGPSVTVFPGFGFFGWGWGPGWGGYYYGGHRYYGRYHGGHTVGFGGRPPSGFHGGRAPSIIGGGGRIGGGAHAGGGHAGGGHAGGGASITR